MLELVIGAVVIAALFYYFCVKPMSYWKDKGVKQGNPVWFFGDNWGSVFRCQSQNEMVQMVYNACPGTRYSGMYQFSLPTLVIKDPELLKQITVKDFDHFTDHRTFISEDADPLWGKNLFALKGQRWRDMRPILSPSFTSSKMRYMFVLMSECAENFVKYFSKRNEDVIELEMKDVFTRFTNDVIATTAFGVGVNSLKEQNNEFYLMGKEATDFTGWWKTLKFFGYFFIPKIYTFFKIKLFSNEVSKFFCDLVNNTIKTREEKGIVRPDMIHLLMEARKGVQKQEENAVIDTGFATVKEADLGKAVTREITNEDITAQALIFFFAGFDSVSSLMCFMSYELAINPDIQKRLRDEIEETNRECGEKLTYEALLKMKYMDMVVSETLRRWPNNPSVDRVCTEPYTIQPVTPDEKPLHIEKGTVLLIPIFAIQQDPKYYPDPERFDPERFNDENQRKIDPYTFLSFGIGPRNCIGSRFALLETKTVMFHLLLEYELVPVKKTKIPVEISKKSFTTTSSNGFWFGLKRIKN